LRVPLRLVVIIDGDRIVRSRRVRDRASLWLLQLLSDSGRDR
jgi:hypothetical protein